MSWKLWAVPLAWDNSVAPPTGHRPSACRHGSGALPALGPDLLPHIWTPSGLHRHSSWEVPTGRILSAALPTTAPSTLIQQAGLAGWRGGGAFGQVGRWNRSRCPALGCCRASCQEHRDVTGGGGRDSGGQADPGLIWQTLALGAIDCCSGQGVRTLLLTPAPPTRAATELQALPVCKAPLAAVSKPSARHR